MILADTSIWIDHLRSDDVVLADALDRRDVSVHPYVLGELALGDLKDRRRLQSLAELPLAVVAQVEEVARLIEVERLYDSGIGYVDVHLLASALLSHDTRLWTRDRRLHAVADRLNIAARLTH